MILHTVARVRSKVECQGQKTCNDILSIFAVSFFSLMHGCMDPYSLFFLNEFYASVCMKVTVYMHVFANEPIFYVSTLASALQYMRSKNVSHMDLKPQNILLSASTSPIIKIAG